MAPLGVGDQAPDFDPKASFQLCASGLGVFDRVVKYGRLKRGNVGDTTDAAENLRHLDGVIDVGASFPVLAALVAVFVGGKVQGGEKSSQIGIRSWHGIQGLPSQRDGY